MTDYRSFIKIGKETNDEQIHSLEELPGWTSCHNA